MAENSTSPQPVAKAKNVKKDVKTSISLLTSARDRLYFNKREYKSYTDFVNVLLDNWFKTTGKTEIKKPEEKK